MPLAVRRMLRAVLFAALFALAVAAVTFGGQIFYAVPGLVAKNVAYLLVGTEQGPVATLLFLLFAAFYLSGIGAVVWLVLVKLPGKDIPSR